MNYLAHAFFSGDEEFVLVGNMIGDFVKGKLDDVEMHDTLKKGVQLHRAIDEFADNHIATQKAKNYFREAYGLYSGAIVDVMYDYFLANDPHYFMNETVLNEFAQQTYATLWDKQNYFPPNYESMLHYMDRENWLYDIRTLKGLQSALIRLQHRAKKMNEIQPAYETIIKHFYALNQIYFEYIEDFDVYVKNKLM